ncbi:MAG: hypothetical protein Q8R28_04860, partial [Dehalococcoidia bacterium]|nr:hypothetical protein [Dehalococcoidia bacterium]
MFKKIQAILVAFLAMCWDVRHIFLPITVYRPDDWRWLSGKMQRSFARHFRRAYWDGILATRGIFPISGATVTAVTPLAMVMNTASVDTADADATDVTT